MHSLAICSAVRWDEARQYSGPSPANMWHAFYEWSLVHAPAHTHSILDTAVNTLADGHHRSHYNTAHCALLFVHWAEYMTQPMEYYADVWQEGIGRELGLFYCSWADCCEREACWDDADGVYMKGLLAQAQPLGELIAAYNGFKLRWAEQRRSKGDASGVSSGAADTKKRGAPAIQQDEPGPKAAKQLKTAAVAAPQGAPATGSGDERSAHSLPLHSTAVPLLRPFISSVWFDGFALCCLSATSQATILPFWFTTAPSNSSNKHEHGTGERLTQHRRHHNPLLHTPHNQPPSLLSDRHYAAWTSHHPTPSHQRQPPSLRLLLQLL